MNAHYVSEAKKYCGDIEKLFITVVMFWTIIAAVGIVLFAFSFTGIGLVMIFVPIIAICMYLSKRSLYISLLVDVNNDIRCGNISTETGIATMCRADKAYKRISGKRKSKFYAGERYVITLDGVKQFRMYKNFNLKRFIDPTVKITYLTNSKVVLNLDVIEVEEQLEDYSEGDISDKTEFTKNRMTLKITNNKIRFPVIVAVTKDDVINRIYINVYYFDNGQFFEEDDELENVDDISAGTDDDILESLDVNTDTKDEESLKNNVIEHNDKIKSMMKTKKSKRELESDLMLTTVDSIKKLTAKIDSTELRKLSELKKIVTSSVNNVYKNFRIKNIKIVIERK